MELTGAYSPQLQGPYITLLCAEHSKEIYIALSCKKMRVGKGSQNARLY
jgi:hypothetical protein